MLRRTAVLLVLALAIAPTLAKADNIGFTGIGLGGTWAWNGVDPLTASFNLTIAHAGVNSVNVGVMTVTTGAFIGGSGTDVDPFTFGPGGSIQVLGCGGGGAEFCLDAVFQSVQVVVNGAGGITLTGSFISGTVHADILSALGLSQPGDVQGVITLVLEGNTGDERGLSTSADATVTPVPEPASLALLGTGLLGLASRFRKKLSA